MFRPVLRRATAVVGTAAIGTGLALGVPSATATAAPIATATYSAGANADLVTLGVDALTFDLADLAIGASTATAGSGTPSSTATADNIRAQVAGLPITVNGISQQAPPDNPTSTASGLNAVDVPLPAGKGVGIGALAVGNVKYQTQRRLFDRMLASETPLCLDFRDAYTLAVEIAG